LPPSVTFLYMVYSFRWFFLVQPSGHPPIFMALYMYGFLVLSAITLRSSVSPAIHIASRYSAPDKSLSQIIQPGGATMQLRKQSVSARLLYLNPALRPWITLSIVGRPSSPSYLPDGRAMLKRLAPSDVPRPDRAPKYRVASL